MKTRIEIEVIMTMGSYFLITMKSVAIWFGFTIFFAMLTMPTREQFINTIILNMILGFALSMLFKPRGKTLHKVSLLVEEDTKIRKGFVITNDEGLNFQTIKPYNA